MITAKRLVLLLLTGIVMASVACGPSEEEQLHQQKKELIQEQKNILLCEDALEKRRVVFYSEKSVQHSYQEKVAGKLGMTKEKHHKKLLSDIDEYCK